MVPGSLRSASRKAALLAVIAAAAACPKRNATTHAAADAGVANAGAASPAASSAAGAPGDARPSLDPGDLLLRGGDAGPADPLAAKLCAAVQETPEKRRA